MSDYYSLRDRKIYVVDTNVVIDYIDIIPGVSQKPPEEPTVDLTGAHIVIPTAVVRELSNFKKEKSERGMKARIALKKIRELVGDEVTNMNDAYRLKAAVSIPERDQLFSVLPVHKHFKSCLPFCPSEEDMDGQIILATLVTAFLTVGDMPIDGSASECRVENFTSKLVTLLTNDNELAIRARERGIYTCRYGYKYPKPYTGRRDVVVPKAIFDEFYEARRVEKWLWDELLPDEPELIANEFIVMELEAGFNYPMGFDPADNPFFYHVGRYDAASETIVGLKYLNSFPVSVNNVGQAIYAESLMSPEVAAVICTGPAGSGKTYMATVYGYSACKNGDFIGVTVVPCAPQGNIGALPGDLDEKMDPEVQPIKNALRNFLINEDSKYRKELKTIRKFGDSDRSDARSRNGDAGRPEKTPLKARLKDHVDLIWDNWFSNIPIENARGRDFSYELAIYDEFQDQSVSQADTLIKRLGTDGKIIITGDINQIHAPYIDTTSSGLVYASRQLMDSPMVAQVCFTEDEVIRHPLVKMIATRQNSKNGDDEDN